MAEPIRIDIREVLRQKVPNAHVPEFVVRYLQHIIHEEEMNAYLSTHIGLEGYEFADSVVHELLGCNAKIEGAENIPQNDEPVIFVSTHPLGGLDGMLNALMLHKYRQRELKVVVTDLLMYMRPLANLFVPVNKVGNQSKEYALRQREMWESGCDVLSFPSGKCARLEGRLGHRGVREQMWHKSFVQKAVEYKRNVVPIRFEGRNSDFFYKLGYWRTKLGVKANAEMLYLVDEMFGSKGKEYTIHVLPEIPWKDFTDRQTPQQWADRVRTITLEK